MSIKTSPREVPLQATYNQTSTPLSNTPNSSSQHVFSDQMQTGNNTSFGSVDMLTQTKEESKSESGGSAQDDGQGGDNSMSTPLSLKGKNGATGPADGKSKPHICQICQRGFTTGGHLQRHQRIHTGVKAFRCPFPGCETRTSRQDNLQQHYRTHLSPSLRRGSGSQARAAVAAAMEAAGLKSTSSRQPRKSKSSAAGTPSSTTSAPNPAHLPSPYQTPTSNGPTHVPYPQYSYEPSPYGGYGHPIPPQGMGMPHPQSANSSRVPSPVNGHSSGHSSVGSMPGAAGHHPQPFFHAFSSPYTYMGSQQPYRYSTGPGGLPSPYSAGPPPGHPGGGPPPHAHHGIFPQNFNSEHNNHGPGGTSGPPHMYSPMQAGFGAPQHARESSYPGVMTPGYANQTPTMSGPNGYPPRTQTSTPLSQSSHHPHSHSHSNSLSHDDPRFPSPPGGSARRRTPPPTSSSIGAPVGGPDQSMLSQGVVDPSHMTTNRVLPSLINGSSGGPTFAGGGYGYQYNSWGSQNGSGAQHLASGGSGSGGNAGHSNGMAPIASGVMSAREMAHRASISSLSDGSINGASEGTAAKAARLNRLTAKIQ